MQGYTVVAPDLFNGKPAPDDHDRPDLGLVALDWLNAHPPNITDPIVNASMKYIKETLKPARIGSAGYCFGGRYAFRAAGGWGVDVVATAHPTFLTDDEIVARVGPATIATGRGCRTKKAFREAVADSRI